MQARGGAEGRGAMEGQEEAATPGTRPGLSPSLHPGWRDPPTPPGLGPRNIGPPTLNLQTEPKPYKPRAPSAVTSTGERGQPSGGEMGPSALPARSPLLRQGCTPGLASANMTKGERGRAERRLLQGLRGRACSCGA